jgi:hypothetical protein
MQVLVDADVLIRGVALSSYHDHAMLPRPPPPAARAPIVAAAAVYGGPVRPVLAAAPYGYMSRLEASAAASKAESDSDSAAAAETASHGGPLSPHFTLPGQVWAVSCKTRGGADGVASSTVFECSEDITPYIGFTASKSKHIWLQFDFGFRARGGVQSSSVDGDAGDGDGDDERQRDYLGYLLGHSAEATGSAEEGDRGSSSSDPTGAMYTVRSVMRNSIEVYEDYCGPAVKDGYPIVQIRTDLARCGTYTNNNSNSNSGSGSSSSDGDVGGISGRPPQQHPRSTHGLLLEHHIATLAAHPVMPYVACGLSDGTVEILSADMA